MRTRPDLSGDCRSAPGEATTGLVLGPLDHFGGLLLEIVCSPDDELSILSLGDDTAVLETTAKTGGQDHPSLAIEAVEVLAEEHFCSFPFSLTVRFPPCLGLRPISGTQDATMTHFAPLVNLYDPLCSI
jgi:hypothetical protein